MSIYPNGKMPISAAAQLYHIRRAQIQAEAQAAHEAEQRKLLAQDIANAIQTKAPQNSDATQTTSNKPKANRTRYPTDSEALGVLQEAKRRKSTKSYSDCSNADIIKCMITEPQSKWARRILHGKLKRKAGGKMLEYPTPINAEKAAANWGKYLSAYLKDHPLKQRI